MGLGLTGRLRLHKKRRRRSALPAHSKMPIMAIDNLKTAHPQCSGKSLSSLIGCVFLLLAALLPASAGWHEDVGETADRGPGGVLKKVWVVKNGAPVFLERDRAIVDARLRQHAKAYHYGLFDGEMIAIGDKPKRSDCVHFGYIHRRDVIIWDTDQALRFVGKDAGRYVDLYRDPAMTDKIGEASVEGPSDPTVMPFPIFGRTDDGRGYQIAFIYTAASGADTYDKRVQESLRRVATQDITGIDVVFVIDVTSSMVNVLGTAKKKIRGLIEEFNSRTVEIFDQSRPLRMRFAFVGYRDRKEGEAWVETVPFAARGQTDEFEERLQGVRALSRLNDDWEEDVCGGISEALKLSWKKENAKVIILIGDAPPNDDHLWPRLRDQCRQEFVRLYALALESQIGSMDRLLPSFKNMAMSTGGQCFELGQADDARTVNTILQALAIEQEGMSQAPEVILTWAEEGATLSRDAQEFVFRGVLPDASRRPIPPTVFVSSKRDGFRQVCLFKSRASLYEMLGEMQTDFVGMIENPSPELLAAINAGGVEIIAELDPKVLQSIVAMDDYARASEEIRRMLEQMPELPGIIRELNDQGMTAEWHELAHKTAVLSRFVSDPDNFYEDRTWVPFDVLE